MKISKKTKFWLYYHACLLIFSFLISLLIKYQQFGNPLHPTVIVVFLSIFLMSVSMGYITIFMINKAATYNHSRINKMILPALFLFYITAFLIANISISIGVLGWYIYSGSELSNFWTHLFRNELSAVSGRFFLWLMFFTIVFFYILWHKSVNKEQKLREENLVYKYKNLKSQLNPHFLFNSFNTLSEIVYEDARIADNYIQKLSGIYRYILENEGTELISLDKEIAFMKHYFDLQKERDNGKIVLEIDCPNADNYEILPISLQILVENALKHNSISQENPLKIQIYSNNGYVVVSNNIRKKNILESSPKTGLANLKERIKLIIDKELVISQDNNNFMVKLPIIFCK